MQCINLSEVKFSELPGGLARIYSFNCAVCNDTVELLACLDLLVAPPREFGKQHCTCGKLYKSIRELIYNQNNELAVVHRIYTEDA